MGLKVLVFLWEYSMLIKRSVSKCFLWLLQKRYMYYIVEIVKSFFYLQMFCSRYGTGTLTQVFLDRVFQECLTYEGEMVIL